MAIRASEISGTAIEDALGGVDIDRDRRLVLRHQRGDVEAFDELYRRYHARLVTFCVRRVGDRHTAEEIAQDAFVKALRAMPTFAGERRFYPWMTVIAHRLCIDHHRRSSRVEPTADVDAGTVEPDHDALFASVDREHLASALERLAPRHREILELREQRGWSYQAIADHLDVPMTTVEALLHRARKALRREFLALSGEERGRRLAVAMLGTGLVAKLKGWLAAVGGPARLAPILGTAAAGTVAVGLVAGPLTGGASGAPAPSTAVSASSTVPVTTAAPTSVDRPAAVVAAPADTVVVLDPRAAASAQPRPAADLGVVAVYSGAEASAWAREQNDEQPVQVPLGPLDIGVDPVQIVTDLLDPADNSVDDTGGAP
jgi:RNA polymerase sigma-70 factor (ECF subfamily)